MSINSPHREQLAGMADGELAIVIAGRREDWPGGTRILTPLEPSREPNGQTLWFGAELDPDGDQVWFRIAEEAIGRMPEKTPADRGPVPSRRPHRLDHAGPAARAWHQPLRGPGLGGRRHLAELHEQGRAPSSASPAVAAARFRARLAGEPSPAGERTARVLAGYRRTAVRARPGSGAPLRGGGPGRRPRHLPPTAASRPRRRVRLGRRRARPARRGARGAPLQWRGCVGAR